MNVTLKAIGICHVDIIIRVHIIIEIIKKTIH